MFAPCMARNADTVDAMSRPILALDADGVLVDLHIGYARASQRAFGTYAGAFRIASLEFGGETEGGVTYSLSLESTGAVTFTAA